VARYTKTPLPTINQSLIERCGNSVFWTSSERQEAFNEALMVWGSMSGEWTDSISFPGNGDSYYDVPRSIISPQRVLFNEVALTQATTYELDYDVPGWESSTNLLTNGDFETWTAGIPDGVTIGSGSIAQESVNVNTGAFALHLLGGSGTLTFTTSTLTSGSPYLVRFSIRSSTSGQLFTISNSNVGLAFNTTATSYSKVSVLLSILGGTSITADWVGDGLVDTAEILGTATPTMWAPVGFNKIALYPTPINGIITIEGISEAPLFPGVSHVQLGEDTISPLLSYAHHVLTFKESGEEHQSTIAGLKGLLAAAATRRSSIRTTAAYVKYMGTGRGESERPSLLDSGPGLGVRS